MVSRGDALYIAGRTLNADGDFLAAGLMLPLDSKRDKPVSATGP